MIQLSMRKKLPTDGKIGGAGLEIFQSHDLSQNFRCLKFRIINKKKYSVHEKKKSQWRPLG